MRERLYMESNLYEESNIYIWSRIYTWNRIYIRPLSLERDEDDKSRNGETAEELNHLVQRYGHVRTE